MKNKKMGWGVRSSARSVRGNGGRPTQSFPARPVDANGFYTHQPDTKREQTREERLAAFWSK